MLRLRFRFPGSAALVQTCEQDMTNKQPTSRRALSENRTKVSPLVVDTGMEVEGHTGQVLEGWVRQLTRGTPSLVPVPRKMSSDFRGSSCSAAEEETALPGAPQEEEKKRAGRFTRGIGITSNS